MRISHNSPKEDRSNNFLNRAQILVDFLLIFTILIAVYALTYRGAFRVDDEHILAARAQSLALWGELSEPQVYGNERVRSLAALPGVHGEWATAVEPGLAYLGAFTFQMAMKFNVGGLQALFALNLYLTALTAVIVGFTAHTLGFSRRASRWSAFAFGLGTMAWPYATAFFRDTLSMLMTSVAFLGWAIILRKNRFKRIGYFLIVLGFVGGVFAKNTVWVLLPSFIFGFTSIWYRKSVNVGRMILRLLGVGLFIAIMVFILSLLPETGPLSRYNLDYLKFLARYFSENIYPGTVLASIGPFISPAKSIFLFSPPIILSIYASFRHWNRVWHFALPAWSATILLAVGQALFYGPNWAGSVGWGLRFMLVSLPPLMIVALPVIETWINTKSRAMRYALYTLMAVSILVQISGALVDWGVMREVLSSKGLDPFSARSSWHLMYLNIPYNIASIFQFEDWQIAWIRILNSSEIRVGIGITTLSLVFGAAIYLLVKNSKEKNIRSLHVPFSLLVFFTGLCFTAYMMPKLINMDPALGDDQAEIIDALAWLQSEATDQDVVIIDSYGTKLWVAAFNRWRSPSRWYSLPFEIPSPIDALNEFSASPSSAAIDLFEWVEGRYNRLWYVATDQAPDYSFQREKSWLDTHFRFVQDTIYAGDQKIEIRLYEVDSFSSKK